MKVSDYLSTMLDVNEEEAWNIGYDMINDDGVRSSLLRIYQSSVDPGVTFPDTLHDFVIDLMKDDRKALREIKSKTAVIRWLKTCYRNTLWHSNQRYLHSLEAYRMSMESVIHAKKYEIDDRTWVLCIMIVKMEKLLDKDWLFMYYRMQLRQFKTTGYEIPAKEIANVLGITHQRYRDRITSIRNKSRYVLASTNIKDLNGFTLDEQQRVADYVDAIKKDETLELILLDRYNGIIKKLDEKGAILALVSREKLAVRNSYEYVFKAAPFHCLTFDAVVGSAEEEIIEDYFQYESYENSSFQYQPLNLLYKTFSELLHREQIVNQLYGIV